MIFVFFSDFWTFGGSKGPISAQFSGQFSLDPTVAYRKRPIQVRECPKRPFWSHTSPNRGPPHFYADFVIRQFFDEAAALGDEIDSKTSNASIEKGVLFLAFRHKSVFKLIGKVDNTAETIFLIFSW